MSNSLKKLESKIEDNIKKAWYENGLCMFEIQQRKLYEKKYGTFEKYLNDRWGFTRDYGYKLIKAANLYQQLEDQNVYKKGEIVDKKLPKNEGQIRELLTLDNLSEQVHVWNEVQESGEKITATLIKAKVGEFKSHPVEVEEVKSSITFVGSETHISNNSGNNHWYTPKKFIESARHVMGSIDLDPASSELANKNVNALAFFDEKINGLNQDWDGNNIWMNPPYSQPLIAQFCEKIINSSLKSAIILVNNATDTRWFQLLMTKASGVCFPSSRIKFIDLDGNPSGSPLQGQAIIYIGSDFNGFKNSFSIHGMVLKNEF